jgi:hypothetical protein
MKDPACVFGCGRGFPFQGRLAALTTKRQGEVEQEVQLPISALLARIRQLIPKQKDDCDDGMARSSGNAALRTPPSPMTDGELSRAIAEFLRDDPSSRT